MTTAAIAVPAPTYQLVPLKLLAESPLNHRKNFDKDKLAELAESIRKHGVLQPALARPVGKAFELVFGHRRLRAASQAGLEVMPVIIREMTDKEVLEAQVIENVQREDVHPLEEAEGYQRLVKDHGYKAEEIAAKIAKSKAYVYRRLKLCELAKPVREALAGDKITVAVAELLARIPRPELQQEALDKVGGSEFGDPPMTLKEAQREIEHGFMLDLVGVPWKLDDAKLTTAGACTTCPKRTGNQAELFSDVKKTDLCTDPKCFAVKKSVAWSRKTEEVNAKGGHVLSATEAKKVFPHHSSGIAYNADYVQLDQRCEEDPKRRTYAELLGAEAPLIVGQDQRGHEVKLVEKAALPKLLEKKGYKLKKDPEEAADERSQKRALAEQKARALRDETCGLLGRVLAEKAEKGLSRALLVIMAFELVRLGDVDSDICRRRAGVLKSAEFSDIRKKIEAWAKSIEKMKEPELRGLVFELTMEVALRETYNGYAPAVVAACKALKVDLKATEKQARTYLDREEATRAAAPAAKKAG